jgi:hypothetical protein
LAFFPSSIKLLLLIAVIAGISIRACWKKSQPDKIIISDVQIAEKTLSNIDVTFTVINKMGVDVKKDFIIKVYNNRDQVIATKITQINLKAARRQKFRKVIQRFLQPVSNPEEIKKATVELHYRSIFD